MKILYAEDEMGLSMAVSEVLKMEGFEVTAVMDGLAADLSPFVGSFSD